MWPAATTGTGDVTVWMYDVASGFLAAKTYADGQGVQYTYTDDGKLATRTWARVEGTNALVTCYAYTNTGELIAIDYSNSTPDVAFSYDRLGRQESILDGQGTRTFAYDAQMHLASETLASTDGRTNVLTRSHDGLGRPSGYVLSSAGSAEVAYGYDAVGHFGQVAWAVGGVQSTATYSYAENSDLLAGYAVSGPGSQFQVTKTYEEHRDLLTQVKSQWGEAVVSQYDYQSDELGRRTSVKNSGTAFSAAGDQFDLYGYNDRSELSSAGRYFGDDLEDTSQPVGTRSFGYAYDPIGNRTQATRAGESESYTANQLNQYAERTMPDKAWILGVASTAATVTVNNHAVTRQGAYFHRTLTLTNTAGAVYEVVEVVGVAPGAGTNGTDVVTVESGRVFVAQSPEAFTYDADGNLASDGRWTYEWDGENRLVGMETRTNAVAAGVPRLKLEFAYDYMSRRVRKLVCSDYVDGAYCATNTIRFAYDGWNLIEEVRIGPAGTCTNAYVWGLDLSGTLQGAGGIGGLLLWARKEGTNDTAGLYAYDANGNVGQVMSASDGTLMAHYEVEPYGRTTVATGESAEDNPFRFSTKYADEETGLACFGRRFYDPIHGRWASRDVFGEAGLRAVGLGQTTRATRDAWRLIRLAELLPEGPNVYTFAGNVPTVYYDPDGQFVPVAIIIGIGIISVILNPVEIEHPGGEGESMLGTIATCAELSLIAGWACSGPDARGDEPSLLPAPAAVPAAPPFPRPDPVQPDYTGPGQECYYYCSDNDIIVVLEPLWEDCELTWCKRSGERWVPCLLIPMMTLIPSPH